MAASQPGKSGGSIALVEAMSPFDVRLVVHVDLLAATFQPLVDAKWRSKIGQFYGLVSDGLVAAEHAFRGLQRPMLQNGNKNADESIVVYSWTPTVDVEWSKDIQSGSLIDRVAPKGKVFVVLVKLYDSPIDGALGSIENWTWVEADARLSHAPLGYDERYREKLWSR